MEKQTIIKKLLTLETLFEMGLKQCREAREEMESVYSPTPRKGKLSDKRLAEIETKAALAVKKHSLKRA